MAPQRDGRAGGAHLSAGTWGRVPSDEAKGPRQKALKGGHGERLWHRKQPQQAPSAQGEQVTSSPTGANFLHLGAHGSRCALAAADDHLGSVVEVRLRDLDGVEATFPRQVAVELVSGRSRAVGVLPLVTGDAELPVHVTAPMSEKSGLSLSQLAFLRLLSAPEHASGRFRLRPASANQPPWRFLPANQAWCRHSKARQGTQAAAHVDEDARALDQVEPAAVRPPAAERIKLVKTQCCSPREVGYGDGVVISTIFLFSSATCRGAMPPQGGRSRPPCRRLPAIRDSYLG